MSLIPYYSRHSGAVIDDAIDSVLTVLGVLHGGTLDLGNAVSSGTVTGVGLDFTPEQVFLQVESPDGGLVMFAVVQRGTLSADGFSFYLSGETDSINYRLHYFLVGNTDYNSS